VPDPSNTELINFNNWTLRVRKTTHPSPRFLLLIHGLTGDENSMWVFARNLPENYWMVAPRAPNPAEPSGYSWRLPQFENMDKVNLDLLQSAAEVLLQLVDEYSASVGIDVSTLDVMGFSQGAAMSNVLAFLYPARIRKVGILAGFVPSGLESLVSQRPVDGKPFFVTHGTKDEMITVDRARASVALLEQAGAKVTYCEDDVAHKVSVHCLHALKDFFAN
jgi:phospholipase/carboxylesterase